MRMQFTFKYVFISVGVGPAVDSHSARTSFVFFFRFSVFHETDGCRFLLMRRASVLGFPEKRRKIEFSVQGTLWPR